VDVREDLLRRDEPNRYDDARPSMGSVMDTLQRGARFLATLVGVVAMVAGLVWALRLAGLVYDGVSSPEKFHETIVKWEKEIGADKFNYKVEGVEYDISRPMAVLFVGAGVLVLVWIGVGVMIAGAKAVQITAGDKAAVKKVLEEVFGPQGKAFYRPRVTLSDPKDPGRTGGGMPVATHIAGGERDNGGFR
jgi:hypothetical protein